MEQGPSWMGDEREAAVNEVYRACVESADLCEDAARRLDARDASAPLARLFEQVAARRRDHAARVRGVLRAHGELPQEPDPDRETLRRAAQWIKAWVASDEERALLDAQLSHEERVAERLREALELELAEDAARCLRELAREAEEVHARLTEASAERPEA